MDDYILFQHFKKFNENLFSTKIKYFQSDNASELVKGKIKTVLDDSGIALCASCPNTPQQNGVAGRKNMHSGDGQHNDLSGLYAKTVLI